MRDAQAASEFEKVCTQCQRRVVLQFVVVSVIRLRSAAASSAVKRTNYVDRRAGVQRSLVAVVAVVLKADLVHSFGPENLRVADLDRMFGGVRVVAGRRQREATDARIFLGIAVKLTAGGERVVLANLVVEACANVGACSRVGNAFVERNDAGQVRRQHDGVHDGNFVDVAPLKIEEERCLLVNRPAYVAVVDGRIVGRLLADEWVAGIECRTVALYGNLSVVLVGAGFGEDLDTAISKFVVFRRERILINSDLTNRRLGRKLSSRKSVNVDLASVRSGGWSG